VSLTEAYREKLGLSTEEECYAGTGCEQCGQTGYRGFTPIFEVMPFEPDIQQAVIEARTLKDLRNRLMENKIFSLRDDGMRKVKQGVTTVQEVLKATML
jgi:type IV pilus assembly protein PilB